MKSFEFFAANLDPYKVPVDYVFRSNMLWFETLIRQEQTQIGGIIVILDMTGVRLAHARYLTPHLAKRTVEVVQEVFPMRFKSFHVVHDPFYFSTILNMLKPFLKDKIRRRVSSINNTFKCTFTDFGIDNNFLSNRSSPTVPICNPYKNTSQANIYPRSMAERLK